MPKHQVNYLQGDGARQFYKHTDFILCSRNNEQLLKIDKALADFPKIPATDFSNRIGCLLVILSCINQWISSKADKLNSGKSSRRLPVLLDLQDQVVAELNQAKHGRAQANWDKLRNARGQIIPDGSMAKGTGGSPTSGVKHLEVKSTIDHTGKTVAGENNWLEILDKDHHRGHEISQLFKKWAASNDTRSFWEYLNDPANKGELSDKVKVKYVTDLALRTLFEVDFQNGKIYSRMTELVQRLIMSGSYNRKFIFNRAGDPEPLNTLAWPSNALRGLSNGWGAYVLSTHDILYCGIHMGGEFHHSSFLAGAPVLASGMIKVRDGVLEAVHEKNGHYQSQEVQVKTFLQFLKRKLPGLNMSQVKLYRFNGYETTCDEVLTGKDLRANRLFGGNKVASPRTIGT